MSEDFKRFSKRKPSKFHWFIQGCIVTSIFAVVGLISFAGGTFFPNFWTLEKVQYEFHKKEVEKVKYLGLEEPAFEFNDKQTFIKAVGKCIDYINFTTDKKSRVPTSIIIAMAGVESGWGTSRFAKEGHNLFGIRTWDDNTPQMKPKDIPDAKFGVKKYPTKCASVQDMINILNNHPAYEVFRKDREKQIAKGKWDYEKLLIGIAPWSTNERYPKIIFQAIIDNKLP